MSDDGEYWFAPKRYGYGTGWPIAVEGWALLAGYLTVIALCGASVEWDEVLGRLAAAAVFVPATILVILVAKARTRGGWRWRWGEKD